MEDERKKDSMKKRVFRFMLVLICTMILIVGCENRPMVKKVNEGKTETVQEKKKIAFATGIFYANQNEIKIHESAEFDSKVINVAGLNDKIVVKGEELSGWRKVVVNGKKGYVSNSFLSIKKISVTAAAPAMLKTENLINVPTDTNSTTKTNNLNDKATSQNSTKASASKKVVTQPEASSNAEKSNTSGAVIQNPSTSTTSATEQGPSPSSEQGSHIEFATKPRPMPLNPVPCPYTLCSYTTYDGHYGLFYSLEETDIEKQAAMIHDLYYSGCEVNQSTHEITKYPSVVAHIYVDYFSDKHEVYFYYVIK